MRAVLKIILLTGLVFSWGVGELNAQYSFDSTSLLEVLEELNQESGFIILYRESMVQGTRISVAGKTEDIFKNLKTALQKIGLDILVDEELRQAVVFKTSESKNNNKLRIEGFIIDDETGERLPYATVSWEENGRLSGVTANEAGYFNIQFQSDQDVISLRSSYIGYENRTVKLSREDLNTLDQLSFRLAPVVTSSEEVIVNGFRQYTNNQITQSTIDIAQGNVLGESNTIKALQQLPSVSLGPALAEGLNVRGSPTDGFQVLLDGVTIYNHSHMFGLFDNFNKDALQTTGLYYGITPATYQGPVGGTLSLITRTGSVNKYHADIGLSNTSVTGTLEGPVIKGKASFLLSGRVSIIDQLNWMNNDKLVSWGLDVNRPARYLTPDNVSLRTDLVHPVLSESSFGDIHAKANFESTSGSRFMLSAYFGYDDISVDAERLFRSFSAGPGDQVEYQPVRSVNKWDNGKLSAHVQNRLSQRFFNDLVIGYSVFKTHFSKDDFTYTQINPGTGSLESFTSDITIKSILNEFTIMDKVEWIDGEKKFSGGISYHYYLGEYLEDSFERPGYYEENEAQKIDAWVHSEIEIFQFINFAGGLRTHYYSRGNYLNLSPRINIKLFTDRIFGFSGGYSRNYQYINRISFSNVLSSDVWVLVDEEQSPSYVDNFTAGFFFEGETLQAGFEGFLKEYENLRLHEIETYSVTNVFSSAPWFSDNSGTGKGLELTVINHYSRFEVNQSVTLSRMGLSNPDINEGVPFLADWNRTWQYTGSLKVKWFEGFESSVTQVYGTGTPNKLNTFGNQEREVLSDYFRTDLRITYKRKVKEADVEASVNLYNIFDVSNPWYRDLSFGLSENSGTQRFISVPVEVYDLGFQPSFSISVKF